MGNCCAYAVDDKADAVEEKLKRNCVTEERDDRVVGMWGGPSFLPAAVAAQGDSSEFKITLDKTTGEKLGVQVVYALDKCTLYVDAVTGGIFEGWNKDNPEKQVKAGDRIVEVNQVRGDVHKMVDVCRQNIKLEVMIHPGDPP